MLSLVILTWLFLMTLCLLFYFNLDLLESRLNDKFLMEKDKIFCRTDRVTVAIQFCSVIFFPHSRELQAQETLQNGQLGCGEGIPDLQPGNLASQAMIEKILSEDPRWQGNVTLSPFSVSLMVFDPIC